MSTFLLVPGAGGSGSYWDRVVALLRAAGHEALAVDLPGPDVDAGLPEYVERTVAAARGIGDLVLVAQSLGGFTAAMAADQLSVSRLVLVNAMIPIPGETPGEWWAATGAVAAREQAAARGGYGPFDVATYFLHDVDVTGLSDDQREESDAVFATPCTFTGWHHRQVQVLVGADDRFFPADFQCQVAKARTGVEADVRPGGHLMALARPREVADYLLAGSLSCRG